MQTREPSIRQLRLMVEKAARDNPHLTTRLEKAAFLLLLRPIATLGKNKYQIGSEDGLRNYEVRNGHCECSDYVRHGTGHPCKHRLALAMFLRLRCRGPAANPILNDVSI